MKKTVPRGLNSIEPGIVEWKHGEIGESGPPPLTSGREAGDNHSNHRRVTLNPS
jgi:hypothetical protein